MSIQRKASRRLLPASAALACIVGISTVSSVSATPESVAAAEAEFAPFVPQDLQFKSQRWDSLIVSRPPSPNSPIAPATNELFPF